MKVPCTCQHEFQDQRYGRGVRIANPVKTDPKQPKMGRCTVCGSEHTKFVGGPEPKPEPAN